MSLFYGLNIASSALFANQKALDVTSHNVANANTKGYTREEVIFKANAPSMGITTSSGYSTGQIGSGVSIEDIERVRNMFLDSQFRNESQQSGEWDIKNQILTAVQEIFNEPSDSGITTVLSDFFDSLQELSKNPQSNDVRSLVRQNAVSLTDTVNNLYNQLSDQKEQAVFNIKTDVTQINSLAKQIGNLDDQIYKFETTGNEANDLRDQRDSLVDQLSALANVKAYETSNGQYRIDIGGRALVNGNVSYDIEYADNGSDITKPSDVIKWQDDGSGVDIQGGEIQGLFDMVYGDNSGLKGIPYYMDQLDDFAYNFAKSFNEVHKQGYTLNSTEDHPIAGTDFFDMKTATDEDHKGYAKIFGISSIISDPVSGLNMIAASGTGEPGNNENALKLAALSTDTTVFEDDIQNVKYDGAAETVTITLRDNIDTSSLAGAKVKIDGADIDITADEIKNNTITLSVAGSPDEIAISGVKYTNGLVSDDDPESITLNAGSYQAPGKSGTFGDRINSIISGLGVDGQQADSMSSNQDNLVKQVNSLRAQTSGVSLDEEMTNLIKYQHSYQAAAKIISTIDNMLDTLLNIS